MSRGKALAAAGPESRDLALVCVDDLHVSLARHQYSLGVVASTLAMVLYAGASLRRVTTAVTLGWSWSGFPTTIASYYSVRLWLLRLGLYQLCRAKEQADDWIWIVDHTLQLGDRKCLVVLGIRQAAWQQAPSRVLCHEDVQLIDLQPVPESNGKVVYRQLQAAAAKTGVPRAIVSDNGPDLHAGIARFRQKHSQTAWLYDIKHKSACLLKQALDKDTSWGKFADQAHRFKKQVSFTGLAALAPPQQRSKARYLNTDVLMNWATRHLQLLDDRPAMVAAGLKPKQVEAKLGWLRKYGAHIQRWSEMLAVVGVVEHYVRHEGIHAAAAAELEATLLKPSSRAARQLRKQLLEFVREQGAQARDSERLLGSSEVLESLIGKFKYMAGERGLHGLTGMVLAFGACVGRHAVGTVQAALEEITNHDVWDWCRAHLGSTVQSVRQQITQALQSEQTRKPLGITNS